MLKEHHRKRKDGRRLLFLALLAGLALSCPALPRTFSPAPAAPAPKQAVHLSAPIIPFAAEVPTEPVLGTPLRVENTFGFIAPRQQQSLKP